MRLDLNDWIGDIPVSFTNLAQLELLSVSYSSDLNGVLPGMIGALTALAYDLCHCDGLVSWLVGPYSLRLGWSLAVLPA